MARLKISEDEIQLNQEIGQKIKSWRIHRKLSTKELGEAINVGLNQVTLYERGIGDIRASKLLKIAKVLNIPVNELFPSIEEGESLTPEMVEILTLIQELEIPSEEVIDFLYKRHKEIEMAEDIEYIEKQMKEHCEKEGFYASKNLPKIAKAKSMMFGKENWRQCPCDGKNPDRFCGSPLCRSDVEEKGVCHCNCYFKNKEDAEK